VTIHADLHINDVLQFLILSLVSSPTLRATINRLPLDRQRARGRPRRTSSNEWTWLQQNNRGLNSAEVSIWPTVSRPSPAVRRVPVYDQPPLHVSWHRGYARSSASVRFHTPILPRGTHYQLISATKPTQQLSGNF